MSSSNSQTCISGQEESDEVERAGWIRRREEMLERLKAGDKPVDITLKGQLEDAYLRLIEYYRQGGKHPTFHDTVYTITGTDEVWMGKIHVADKAKKAIENKGCPVTDTRVFQPYQRVMSVSYPPSRFASALPHK